MAVLIPNNLASRSDVRGSVQEVARLLRDATDDDVTVVSDVHDPDKPLWVIHGQRGVLALHVLDGGKRSIQQRLKGFLGREVTTLELLDAVADEADPIARDIQRSPHLNTQVPLASAVVMGQVRAQDIERGGYTLDRILAKEDLRPEAIDAALGRLFSGSGRLLTAKEEKVVRVSISPEIRIRDRYEHADRPGQIAFRAPDIDGDEDVLAVLDRQQQQLAMYLGEGYRVIRGVAGSGKSLVLTHRARWLASQAPDLRVLLTCFNVVIAKALAAELADVPNVSVQHLDSLAWQTCRHYGVAVSGNGDEKWVRQRAAAAEFLTKKGNGQRFDVVLVDEGQDFDNAMFDLAYAALQEADGDFIVALDAAQNIYRKSARWNPPGQTARGRSTVLRVNYRNTKEILEAAYWMLMRGNAHDTTNDQDLDDPSVVVHPEASSRRGADPRVVSARDRAAEIRAVCDQLEAWHAGGVAWSDMLVLFGSERAYQGSLYHECQRRDIPYFCITFGKNKRKVMEAGETVRASTIQSMKGVEFSHVAICGVNDITAGPKADNDEVARRRMLYVGMTRATDHLFVTVSGSGPIGTDLLAR
jgi:hypothetical protein